MSTTAISCLAFGQLGNLHLRSHPKPQPSTLKPYSLPNIFTGSNGSCFSAKRSVGYSNTNRRGRSKLMIKMDLNAISDIQSGASIDSGSLFPEWSSWMLLTIVPIVLSFTKSKWGPLLEVKKKLDTTIDAVDNMAEIVEDVAKTVDELADEVTEKLPDGSKLKDAISRLDDAVEGVIKGADFVEELVEKVEELEKTMESQVQK